MTRKFVQVPGLHVENWLPAIAARYFLRRNVHAAEPAELNPETPAAAPHKR